MCADCIGESKSLPQSSIQIRIPSRRCSRFPHFCTVSATLLLVSVTARAIAKTKVSRCISRVWAVWSLPEQSNIPVRSRKIWKPLSVGHTVRGVTRTGRRYGDCVYLQGWAYRSRIMHHGGISGSQIQQMKARRRDVTAFFTFCDACQGDSKEFRSLVIMVGALR